METRILPPGVTLVGIPRGRLQEFTVSLVTKVAPGTLVRLSHNPQTLFDAVEVSRTLWDAKEYPWKHSMVVITGDIFWSVRGVENMVLDVKRVDFPENLPPTLLAAEVRSSGHFADLVEGLGDLQHFLKGISYEDFHDKPKPRPPTAG